MKPDYEIAAIKAAEILVKYKISAAPVDPLPILKNTDGVLVLSFEEMSNRIHVDRNKILRAVGCQNQDAVTTVYVDGSDLQYVVAYNQQLPLFLVQRSLARELGHIILGHDGSRPEEVRNAEAKCFAHHLLAPRPLIHSVMATGIRFTTEVMNNLTSCNENCLACMRKLPPVYVPADLNRAVRDQFFPYIKNYFEFQRHASLKDRTALADLGNYMEGYEE